ncbi:MAG TPA: cyclodeaminase/cyclohydrolase family protein [Blastocatellia bacterium]|nr:cyclodeaminase/cyclohydrolase family protein [Blastocatellia bacterium]
MTESAVADSKPDLSNSVGTFADLVAAGTPAPGGGSVSAYCGMLAASLGEMVCNLTIGKPKYAEVETRLREIKSELNQLGARLRQLIAEDAESFEAVLRSYRLPKESDEQKSHRAAQIQIALQGAVAVPVETAQRSSDVIGLLRELADIGNNNALSDVAVGAQLAKTAITGASYNVGVNLDSISDREAVDKTRERMTRLIEQSTAIADQVESKLRT